MIHAKNRIIKEAKEQLWEIIEKAISPYSEYTFSNRAFYYSNYITDFFKITLVRLSLKQQGFELYYTVENLNTKEKAHKCKSNIEELDIEVLEEIITDIYLYS